MVINNMKRGKVQPAVLTQVVVHESKEPVVTIKKKVPKARKTHKSKKSKK